MYLLEEKVTKWDNKIIVKTLVHHNVYFSISFHANEQRRIIIKQTEAEVVNYIVVAGWEV